MLVVIHAVEQAKMDPERDGWVALPGPNPGFFVCYDYFWSCDVAAGRDQAKDRPTCLIAASDSPMRRRYIVLLPITHYRPDSGPIGIENRATVKQAIWLERRRADRYGDPIE